MAKKSVLLLILVLFIAGCGGKDNGTDPQSPGLSGLVIPINNNYNDSLRISVLVSDPQGLADLDSVWALYGYLDGALNDEVMLYDDGTHGDSTSGDGRFGVALIPAGGVFEFGYYRIEISAVDLSGNTAGPISGTFWSVNGDTPILFGATGPASLQRGSTDTSYIHVNAYDPDGPADIDSVYFIVTRPDSTSNQYHFYLRDDGQFGDPRANDGQYTLGIQAPTPQNQSGEYIFTFYALDLSGNQSNNPYIIITVF